MRRLLFLAVVVMTMLSAGTSGAVADDQPTIRIGAELQPPQGNVTRVRLSGTVFAGSPGGRIVSFTGAVAGQTMTSPSGAFEATLMGAVPGTVTATIQDRGRPISTLVILPDHQVTVTEFSARVYSGQTWLLLGRVQGNPATGVVVRFSGSGLPSLAGRTATTNSDGSFSLLITFGPGENGIAQAAALNYWNVASEPLTCVVQQ